MDTPAPTPISKTPTMPTTSLRITLCIALVLLAVATLAIVWQETIIDGQRQVIRDLSGVHASGGKK